MPGSVKAGPEQNNVTAVFKKLLLEMWKNYKIFLGKAC